MLLCYKYVYANPSCSETVVFFISVLQLSPREDEVFYDVVAIVDPLTREGQKLSPLLIVRLPLFSP